jgi:hypothetical protein
MSGVLPLDHFVRAHYAYLPSVGACILGAMLLRRAHRALGRALPRRTALLASAGALGLMLAACLLQTVLDNLTWRSTGSLDARVLELEGDIPDQAFAHPAMTRTANRFAVVHLTEALSLSREDRCAEVPAHCERARWLTRKRSLDVQARQLEAHCSLSTGARAEAMALYLGLVNDAPTDPLPPTRVAQEYLRRGDVEAARPFLALACERGEPAACEEAKRIGSTGN